MESVGVDNAFIHWKNKSQNLHKRYTAKPSLEGYEKWRILKAQWRILEALRLIFLRLQEQTASP